MVLFLNLELMRDLQMETESMCYSPNVVKFLRRM